MANIVIKNTGAQEGREVNQTKAFTGVSNVSLTLDGKQIVWGPGESKTLTSPFAEQALAADNRLVEISRS